MGPCAVQCTTYALFRSRQVKEVCFRVIWWADMQSMLHRRSLKIPIVGLQFATLASRQAAAHLQAAPSSYKRSAGRSRRQVHMQAILQYPAQLIAASAAAWCTWTIAQYLTGRRGQLPFLQWQQNDFNVAVMSRCPTIRYRTSLLALFDTSGTGWNHHRQRVSMPDLFWRIIESLMTASQPA